MAASAGSRAPSGASGDDNAQDPLAKWLMANGSISCYSDVADILLDATRLGEGHRKVLKNIASRKRSIELCGLAYTREVIRLWVHSLGRTPSLDELKTKVLPSPAWLPADEFSCLGRPSQCHGADPVAVWRSVKVDLASVLASEDTDLMAVEELAGNLLQSPWPGGAGSTLVRNLTPLGFQRSARDFLTLLFEVWTSLVPEASGDQLLTALEKTPACLEKLTTREMNSYQELLVGLPNPCGDQQGFFQASDCILRLCSLLEVREMGFLADDLFAEVVDDGKGRYWVESLIHRAKEYTGYLFMSTLIRLWKDDANHVSPTTLYEALATADISRGKQQSAIDHFQFVIDMSEAFLKPGPARPPSTKTDWSSVAHAKLCGWLKSEDMSKLIDELLRRFYHHGEGVPSDVSTLITHLVPPCCDLTDRMLLWTTLCVWKCLSDKPTPSKVAATLWCNKEASAFSDRLISSVESNSSSMAQRKGSPGALVKVWKDRQKWQTVYECLATSDLSSDDVDDLADVLLTEWDATERHDALSWQLPYWLEASVPLKLWMLLFFWRLTVSASTCDNLFNRLWQGLLKINRHHLRLGTLLGLCWDNLRAFEEDEMFQRPSSLQSEAAMAVQGKLSTSELSPWSLPAFMKQEKWLVTHLDPLQFRMEFKCAGVFDDYQEKRLAGMDHLDHNWQLFSYLKVGGKSSYVLFVEFLESMPLYRDVATLLVCGVRRGSSS